MAARPTAHRRDVVVGVHVDKVRVRRQLCKRWSRASHSGKQDVEHAGSLSPVVVRCEHLHVQGSVHDPCAPASGRLPLAQALHIGFRILEMNAVNAVRVPSGRLGRQIVGRKSLYGRAAARWPPHFEAVRATHAHEPQPEGQDSAHRWLTSVAMADLCWDRKGSARPALCWSR
eukprot:1229750-Prymnesium_polylepis.1